MRLPFKSSELIVYVFRNMIKLTTLIDIYLSNRSTQATAEAFEWLTTGLDIEQSLQKPEQVFPEIPGSDFKQAVDLLASGGSLYTKLRLGQRFNKNLKKYRRYGPAAQSILSVVAVGRTVIDRLARKQKHMHFLTGGKIVYSYEKKYIDDAAEQLIIPANMKPATLHPCNGCSTLRLPHSKPWSAGVWRA